MRKYSVIIALFTLFLTQASFAGGKEPIKECESIVNACKNAGYTEDSMSDKSLWADCLKPIIMGKTVSDVTVDGKDVKECLKAKIEKVKKELKDLQSAR